VYFTDKGYVLLVLSRSNGRTHYIYSTDGIDWVRDSDLDQWVKSKTVIDESFCELQEF
jgi:hypothetical protein